MSQWQPIETAPKDGTAILAGSVNHDAREVVCWQDGVPSGSSMYEPNEGWVNAGAIKDRFYANPRWFTHWQPLPDPPPADGAPTRHDPSLAKHNGPNEKENL